VIEDDLKNLKLVATAVPLRERILVAAGRARKDRLVGKWISRAAICSLMSAILAGWTSDKGRSNFTPEPSQDPGLTSGSPLTSAPPPPLFKESWEWTH